MAGGRPRIIITEAQRDQMLELAKEGASIVELSVELGISRETFYDISDRDPLFSDTIKKCKQLSEAWWEKKGRTNLENKDFNYTGWYMNMKNRFGWKDKSEQSITHSGEVTFTNDVPRPKDEA
jgi:hypothetical protein